MQAEPESSAGQTARRLDHDKHALAPEQISPRLKTAEQLIARGKSDAVLCRVIEVTTPTSHRRRQRYGVMTCAVARCLTQLETQNGRINGLLAVAALEKVMLRDSVVP